MTFDKGVFTTCQNREGKKCPPWALQAKKIKQITRGAGNIIIHGRLGVPEIKHCLISKMYACDFKLKGGDFLRGRYLELLPTIYELTVK